MFLVLSAVALECLLRGFWVLALQGLPPRSLLLGLHQPTKPALVIVALLADVLVSIELGQFMRLPAMPLACFLR